ncbi:MAG: FN3 associated domain-containing protein [Dehalococcoidales bacterium]
MRNILLTISAVLLASTLAQAKVVVFYGFNDNLNSFDNGTNSIAGNFSFGKGVNQGSYSAVKSEGTKSLLFSNSGFDAITETLAIQNNDYIWFEISIPEEEPRSLSILNFYTLRRPELGLYAPDNFSIYSNLDNFSLAIAKGKIPLAENDKSNEFTTHMIDMTGIEALHKISGKVEFRIYFWASQGSGVSSQRQWRIDALSLQEIIVDTSSFDGALLVGVQGIQFPPDAKMFEIAQYREVRQGLPKYSDVCFSSRWRRPRTPGDPHHTLHEAAGFFSTRLDWVYSTDAEWIQECRSLGYNFGGAVNTIVPDSPDEPEVRLKGRLRAKNGDYTARPRWAAREVWEGCINHPDYRNAYKEQLKIMIDGGADSFQMDDPLANIRAIDFGACWCEACRKLAKEKGYDLEKDMLVFQTESVRHFYEDMRAWVNEYAGCDIPWSSNNREITWDMSIVWGFPYNLFDYGIAEIDMPTPKGMIKNMEDSIRLKMSQVYTYRTTEQDYYRRTIATAYATGQHMIVPWDVWLGDLQPRYFAEPSEFGDLYGFVRSITKYLDGYENAAYWGKGLDDKRYKNNPPITLRGGSCETYAFVRAKPGDPTAPVVIHLVDWADNREAFTAVIDPIRFFGDCPVRVSLAVPAPFNETVHEQARITKNFALLSEVSVLASGRKVNINIPALHPWGVLIIEPEAAAEGTLWEPQIKVEWEDYFSPQLKIKLDGISTSNIVTRYTLDGSDPESDSLLYEKILRVDDNVCLKARNFSSEGISGPVATGYFSRVDIEQQILPDAESLRTNLKLWISAESLSGMKDAGAPVIIWPSKAGPELRAVSTTLPDGTLSTPPVFNPKGLNGMPAVCFDGKSSLLAIEKFVNTHLAGKPFTVFLVMDASSPGFGISGNSINGAGRVPRFCLSSCSMVYGEILPQTHIRYAAATPAVYTFGHNGIQSGYVWVGDEKKGERHDWPVIDLFGSNGSLAVPFAADNRGQSGALAEIIIYDRLLTDSEREGIQIFLAEKANLSQIRQWN